MRTIRIGRRNYPSMRTHLALRARCKPHQPVEPAGAAFYAARGPTVPRPARSSRSAWQSATRTPAITSDQAPTRFELPHLSGSHGERNSIAGLPAFGRQFDVNVRHDLIGGVLALPTDWASSSRVTGRSLGVSGMPGAHGGAGERSKNTGPRAASARFGRLRERRRSPDDPGRHDGAWSGSCKRPGVGCAGRAGAPPEVAGGCWRLADVGAHPQRRGRSQGGPFSLADPLPPRRAFCPGP